MAIISANTFNPLKRYIGCRLQQGVPIVDADWNEQEDIRKFELRAFLKWFVGDGVPEGTDGFRIIGQGLANDFVISAGPAPTVPGADPVERALRDVGRLLVDGRDVLIDADVAFRQQPLHVSQPGAAARAAALGVPSVPELPSLDGEVLIYVDVWERLVTPSEDPSLVFPGLGTESCARLKREWVVRARASAEVPRPASPPDPDYLPGHSYYAIARVTRRSGSPHVNAADVADLRARRNVAPPATFLEDVLSTTPERYRRGLDRPAISLRAALNSLLRGELPGTPEARVWPYSISSYAGRAVAFDRSNGLVAAWVSMQRVTNNNAEVFISRLSLGNLPAGFDTEARQLTSGLSHLYPSLAVLPNGEFLLAYSSSSGTFVAYYKRGTYETLATAPQVALSPTLVNWENQPHVFVSGNVAVFIYHRGSKWCFRRLRHTDNTWLDANPVDLHEQPTQPSGATSQIISLHARVAENGHIWAMFRVQNALQAVSLDPMTGMVDSRTFTSLDPTTAADERPFILPTKAGPVWSFWQTSEQGLYMARFASGAWGTPQLLPNTLRGDREPSAIEDTAGGLWLFFTRETPSGVFCTQYNPTYGTWSQPRQVTFPAGAERDTDPLVLQAPDRSFWLFWSRAPGSLPFGHFKQVILSL